MANYLVSVDSVTKELPDVVKTVLSATFTPSFADTAITYDGSGNVESVVEYGIETTYTYNSDGSVAKDTRLGVTRTYTYDSAGNLTEIAS